MFSRRGITLMSHLKAATLDKEAAWLSCSFAHVEECQSSAGQSGRFMHPLLHKGNCSGHAQGIKKDAKLNGVCHSYTSRTYLPCHCCCWSSACWFLGCILQMEGRFLSCSSLSLKHFNTLEATGLGHQDPAMDCNSIMPEASHLAQSERCRLLLT